MAVKMRAWDQQLMDIRYIYNKCVDRFDDKLSGWLWQHFQKVSQKYKHYDQKIRLKDQLSQCLSKYFNESPLKFAGIFFSGSTANGFATLDSDLDLCFVVTDDYYDIHNLNKVKKLRILSEIENLLIINNIEREDSQLIDARVPILRYVDKQFGIKVEINVNNEDGIRNTRLLYCYSKLDWRVVPICIAIKTWAKEKGVIDSYNGHLSSYAVELMAIFYLQNCSPPVLPCLQQTDYQQFSYAEEIITYQALPDLSHLTPFQSQNTDSLSKLFIGFLGYYLDSFDFMKEVASVRLGQPKAKKKFRKYFEDPEWEFICVEEPFSRTNAARTVYDVTAYNKIVAKFEHSFKELTEAMASKCSRSQQCRCYE